MYTSYFNKSLKRNGKQEFNFVRKCEPQEQDGNSSQLLNAMEQSNKNMKLVK